MEVRLGATSAARADARFAMLAAVLAQVALPGTLHMPHNSQMAVASLAHCGGLGSSELLVRFRAAERDDSRQTSAQCAGDAVDPLPIRTSRGPVGEMTCHRGRRAIVHPRQLADVAVVRQSRHFAALAFRRPRPSGFVPSPRLRSRMILELQMDRSP